MILDISLLRQQREIQLHDQIWYSTYIEVRVWKISHKHVFNCNNSRCLSLVIRLRRCLVDRGGRAPNPEWQHVGWVLFPLHFIQALRAAHVTALCSGTTKQHVSKHQLKHYRLIYQLNWIQPSHSCMPLTTSRVSVYSLLMEYIKWGLERNLLKCMTLTCAIPVRNMWSSLRGYFYRGALKTESFVTWSAVSEKAMSCLSN